MNSRFCNNLQLLIQANSGNTDFPKLNIEGRMVGHSAPAQRTQTEGTQKSTLME